MIHTDFRLKVIHFFRKYKKVLVAVFIIWGIVFLVNKAIRGYTPKEELQTTYTPHKSVMDEGSSVAKSISDPIEELIDRYVTFCNDADWDAAYGMLSEDCKKYAFNNNINEFMEYVYTKMPTPKKYAIQNFSNDGNIYIYQIKYTDDMLATGLTDSTYQYTEEKMVFKKQKDGSIEMLVGNFVEYKDIKNISENEYLKVDVKAVVKYYSVEKYFVTLKNRSEYTIVIANEQEDNEVALKLNSGDIRTSEVRNLILEPGESKNVTFAFSKYYDNNDDAMMLILNSVRVMENYSGTEVSEDIIQSEIQNAVAKFGVTVAVNNDE